MGYMYIGILLLMKTAQGFFIKKVSVSLQSRSQFLSYTLFNFIVCTVFSIGYLLVVPFGAIPNAGALAVSILGGVSMAVCSISGLAALQSGTVALCNLASAAGLLIPCAMGPLLFGERLSIWQGGGVLLLLAAAWFLSGSSQAHYGRLRAKTVVLLLISLLSNGTTMLAQKMFSFYYPDTGTGLFSLVAFLFAAVALFVCKLPHIREKEHAGARLPRHLWGYGLILAGALFVVNLLSTIAASLVPSVILFTLVNGGGMLIAAAIGAACFHEKLTIRSLTGVALGIASLLIINLL